MAPMHMGIDACKVGYSEKQLSLWQITPNTVEIIAVTPATEVKKARESPLLVHSSPDQCQNGFNVHGYKGNQGWVCGQTSLLMANLGRSS
jgi:hypothetical protein